MKTIKKFDVTIITENNLEITYREIQIIENNETFTLKYDNLLDRKTDVSVFWEEIVLEIEENKKILPKQEFSIFWTLNNKEINRIEIK